MQDLKQAKGRGLPCYGVGVEWAFELEKVLHHNLDRFTCFELIPENFFRQGQKFLDQLQLKGLPSIIHGVELSFGSAEPIKQEHFDNIKAVADKVNTVMVSEHLSMTECGGVEIGQLTPLAWTEEMVGIVSRKIEQIQSQLNYPFAIENVTNRFMIPNNELTETQFINKIVANTGCGFQLDLNNIDTNGYNYGFDPFEWLAEINLDSVVSIHLAGGVFDDEGTLLDSHSAPVRDRVWDLYRFVCDRVTPSSTIVEWTDSVPTIEGLESEVRRAEKILHEGARKRGLSVDFPVASSLAHQAMPLEVRA